MPDITPTRTLDINEELKNMELFKYHLSGISQISLNRLTDMLDGKVEFTEPSNPFNYLVETSALNTTFAIKEFALLIRKRFQRLANTDEDLYLHMSDYDFLGRFSEPAFANVAFNLMFNDFKSKATYDPVTKDYILKLPRHLKLTVSDYVFTLTSAIIIRLTETGVIDVKFENQDFNNIFPVETNHISFVLRNISDTETYLSFALKMPEIDIETADVAIDPSSVVRDYILFNKKRQFYFFRAFFYKDDKWNEMIVTHTNDVYDVNTPTCIIKVLPTDNKVEYHIPSIYINTGMVSTKVRFLVYTTMGKVTVNFSDYQMSDFSTEYGDVFPEVELDDYTKPIQTITKVIYTTDSIDGGKNGMSFEEMKQAVIDNSIGDRKLPITAKQLSFTAKQTNFKIIKDVDVVTHRMYKLETEVPSPLTRYPVTKFNLDIMEYSSTVENLRLGNTVTSFGDDVTVLPEGTIFRLDDGVLTLVSPQEALQLKSLTGANLVSLVNSTTYLSLYYHYVLDTSEDHAVLRAYDLTTPSIPLISFKEFNPSTRVGISTTSANLFKSPNGYTLDVLSNLQKYVETIKETNITPFIVYTDVSGARFYLEGNLYTMISNSPVYRFSIDTDYHIDKQHRVYISNFKDSNGNTTTIGIDLSSKLEIIYLSDVIPYAFASSQMDQYVHTSYLAGMYCAVTLEDVQAVFGHYLERLFSGLHTATSVYEYETYAADVPLTYEVSVYDGNNDLIHAYGDIVYDDQGEIVYKHRKGDVKLQDGFPIPISELDKERYLNLLLVDYRVLLSTPATSREHNQQIKNHITEMALENSKVVHEQLLDNSEAYVVIPKTVGHLRVQTDSRTLSIKSMQEFFVDVYVRYDIYNNAKIRDNISYTIVKTIDDYLYGTTIVKKSEVLNILYEKLREFIVTVSLPNFTELDDEYIELLDPNSRLSIAKTLILEADGYNLIEDVTIRFKLIES